MLEVSDNFLLQNELIKLLGRWTERNLNLKSACHPKLSDDQRYYYIGVTLTSLGKAKQKTESDINTLNSKIRRNKATQLIVFKYLPLRCSSKFLHDHFGVG